MRTRKVVYTVLVVVAATIALTGSADNLAETQAEAALARALATFAVARTLNGAISVAQGTEIALEPGGVGVILTPGQILDPVNDLVEQFSSVLLIAASSIGLQRILLEVASWWVLSAVLLFFLGLWLFAVWSGVPSLTRQRGLIGRIAVFLLILRFAMPVVVISTEFFFDAFLDTDHQSAAIELDASTTDISEMSATMDDAARGDDKSNAAEEDTPQSDADPDPSTGVTGFGARLRESAKELIASAGEWADSVNMSTIDDLQKRASEITSNIVNLIVIFVLQTIILPVAFLWLFVEALKQVAGRSLAYATREKDL